MAFEIGVQTTNGLKIPNTAFVLKQKTFFLLLVIQNGISLHSWQFTFLYL